MLTENKKYKAKSKAKSITPCSVFESAEFREYISIIGGNGFTPKQIGLFKQFPFVVMIEDLYQYLYSIGFPVSKPQTQFSINIISNPGNTPNQTSIQNGHAYKHALIPYLYGMGGHLVGTEVSTHYLKNGGVGCTTEVRFDSIFTWGNGIYSLAIESKSQTENGSCANKMMHQIVDNMAINKKLRKATNQAPTAKIINKQFISAMSQFKLNE